MFNQCSMGDACNQNYSCENPTYDQWWYRNEPWYGQYPLDYWSYWNYGFNIFETERPAYCHCHQKHYPNKSTKNSGWYGKHESGETMDPTWKSEPNDCFIPQMATRKIQSDLFKSGSKCSLKKSNLRRKNRKAKHSAMPQSTATLDNLLGKLGMKICEKGGTLAYILLEPDANKKDHQNCGDNLNVPSFTNYNSQMTPEMKNQFLDELNRQLNETEALDPSEPAHKKFIKNFNKLYADLGGSLRFDVKSEGVQSSTEEFVGNSSSIKNSKSKVKTSTLNKNIRKIKKTVRIEEPLTGSYPLKKEKQRNNENHPTSQERKLRKQQSSNGENVLKETSPGKKGNSYKEKRVIKKEDPSKRTTNIAAQKILKNKNSFGMSEQKPAPVIKKSCDRRINTWASRKFIIQMDSKATPWRI